MRSRARTPPRWARARRRLAPADHRPPGRARAPHAGRRGRAGRRDQPGLADSGGTTATSPCPTSPGRRPGAAARAAGAGGRVRAGAGARPAAALPAAELAALVPLLQPVVMPARPGEGLRCATRELLARLRDGLAVRARRGGARAGPPDQVLLGHAADRRAPGGRDRRGAHQDQRRPGARGRGDQRLAVVARRRSRSGWSTFLGAALTLRAFSPVRVPLWQVTLVQAGGAFLAVAAPAAPRCRRAERAGDGAARRVRVARGGDRRAGPGLPVRGHRGAAAWSSRWRPGPTAATALLPSGGTLESDRGGRAAGRRRPAGHAVAALGARASVMPMLRQVWPRLIDVLGEPGRIVRRGDRQRGPHARLGARVRRGAVGVRRAPEPR